MRRLIEDVTAFHLACDVPVRFIPMEPEAPRRKLRIKLIDEEVNRELIPALIRGDMAKIADGLTDSIYVHVGAAIEYGIPLEKIWEIVQRANMAKVDPVTGKVRKREDGKVLKPDGWQPPDDEIAKVLEEAIFR